MNDVASTGPIDINISDHLPVYVVRKRIKKGLVAADFMGRSYRRYNKEDMLKHMKELNWDEFFTCIVPEKAWKFFYEHFTKYLDLKCPIKRNIFKKDKPEWLTPEVAQLMRDRDLALRRAKRTKKPEDIEIAKFLKNRSNIKVKKSHDNHIKNQLIKYAKDPKKFWEELKKLLPKASKSSSLNLKDSDGSDITSSDAAKHINDYFANIGKNLADKIQGRDINLEMNEVETDQVFEFKHIELDELHKELNFIDVSKSSGFDHLSSRILKDCLIGMSREFLFILNLSITHSSFPKSWKTAKITPIPKIKNPSSVSDLRPISLLPITGKILEKFVHKQASSYLEGNKLLTDNQNGFRAKRGTQDTIIKLAKNIFESLNNGKMVGAVYID